MAAPRYIVENIEDISPEVRPQQQRPQQQGNDFAFNAIMLALKSLSQGTIIALSRLTNLAMVVSVFWLFMSIPNPSQTQIVWGGMYAMFILVLAYLINRGDRS